MLKESKELQIRRLNSTSILLIRSQRHLKWINFYQEDNWISLGACAKHWGIDVSRQLIFIYLLLCSDKKNNVRAHWHCVYGTWNSIRYLLSLLNVASSPEWIFYEHHQHTNKGTLDRVSSRDCVRWSRLLSCAAFPLPTVDFQPQYIITFILDEKSPCFM